MYYSISQALLIWDDLRDAVEDKASHGACSEIYAYRLMGNKPSGNIEIVDCIRAARALVEIIDIFRERYHNVIFTIEGLDYHSWLDKYGHTFSHRVLVCCQY